MIRSHSPVLWCMFPITFFIWWRFFSRYLRIGFFFSSSFCLLSNLFSRSCVSYLHLILSLRRSLQINLTIYFASLSYKFTWNLLKLFLIDHMLRETFFFIFFNRKRIVLKIVMCGKILWDELMDFIQIYIGILLTKTYPEWWQKIMSIY